MRKNKRSGVYCIENISTKKKYIGQSIDIDDRWSKHKSELNHGSHDNSYLQNAWLTHGESDFKFYVLEYCDEQYLDIKEQFYIDKYNTLNRACGYNLKSGGQVRNYYSDELRKKMSDSVKESYLDSNLKERRRADALAQWADPEIKSKIIGENNGMYGRHHTDEVKQKISMINKGRMSAKRNRTPVFCVELKKVFEDATNAATELLLDSSCILKVCRGERKTCGGYHWNFYSLGNI